MALDPFKLVVTGQSLIRYDIRQNVDTQTEELKSIVRSGDISFTNLETTLHGTYGGWPLKGSFFGSSEPQVLASLQELGFNALALANNHAFDLGPPGILTTADEVASRGFLHAGIGRSRTQAMCSGERSVKGRKVALFALDGGPGPSFMYAEDASGDRVARPGVNRLKVTRRFDVDVATFDFLKGIQSDFSSSALELANYAQPEDPPTTDTEDQLDFYGTIFQRSSKRTRRIVVDEKSRAEHLRAISLAASGGCFVIVYLHHHHWEPDWRTVPSWVQSFAKDCVSAGAKAFVSHGSPALQGIEIFQGAPLFYGLGNFLFHTTSGEKEWSPPEVWQSVIASCSFSNSDELTGIAIHPITIGAPDEPYHLRLLPRLASGAPAEEILSDLDTRCRCFGTALTLGCDRAFISPADAAIQ